MHHTCWAIQVCYKQSYNFAFDDLLLCFPLSQNYQIYEREESKLVKKWSTFKFLADDDDETDDHKVSSPSASS